MDVMELLTSTLIQGLIYALISYGVYITYSILDFPDLGVDGTFPLGAAVTAVLLTRGVDPWLTLVAAVAVGALAGLFTGVVHVCLRVRNLLAGIITMTALFSINLQIAGSNLTVDRGTDTIFTSAPVMALLGDMTLMGRKLVVSLVLAVVIKLLLDLYFKTKSGLLLRAVGDNADLVTTLAKDRGAVKILGLVISNALVALAGCIVCHEGAGFPCRHHRRDFGQRALQAVHPGGSERRTARQYDEAGHRHAVPAGAGAVRPERRGDHPCLRSATLRKSIIPARSRSSVCLKTSP